MTDKTDMLLQRGSDGVLDISIGDDGDYTPAYGYETSLQMSVFCDSALPLDDVSNALLRGGWAGNENSDESGYELGSLLWTKKQARKTQLDKNEAVAIIKNALSHFVPDRAKSLNVTGNLTTDGIEVSAVILRYDNETVNILFRLWETTGNVE